MNTVDFIRYHTRLILEKEERATQSAPRAGEKGGDFKGKYSKSVRTGRISSAAKQALGLAGSDPKALLSRLGLGEYQTAGGSKVGEVVNYFNAIRNSSPLMGAAFEKPVVESNHVDIPVFLLGGKVPAIKQTQAPRYIKAVLLAGHSLGLVDFDIESNPIGLRSVESDEEDSADDKKYFVRVTIK